MHPNGPLRTAREGRRDFRQRCWDTRPLESGLAGEEPAAREYPSHLLARGAVFRRKHRLYGPMMLYGGRIDPGKGCEELIEYFRAYLSEGGDGTLVLMGVKMMSLPEEPST